MGVKMMKEIIAGCAMAGILAAGSPSGSAWAGGRRALVILSQRGFQEKEFFPVRDTLLSAGISCSVASSVAGEAVSVYGTKTACDKSFSGINASEYDAVVFIGGPGAESFFNDPAAHKLARDTVSSGRILAAICIAPVILANAGVLKGRKATVFPGEEGFLVSGGALYTAKAVEKDGNIITADGPSSAQEFARALAEALR